MKKSNPGKVIIYLLLLVMCSSCSPHQSILYVGGLRNTEFHNSAFLIDGVFFADLNEGGLLKEVKVTPGIHSFVFLAKNGKRKEFKIRVEPGENGLEYVSRKKIWLWNFKEYPDSSNIFTIIE